MQAGGLLVLAQGTAASRDANCKMTGTQDMNTEPLHSFMPGYHYSISVSRIHRSITADVQCCPVGSHKGILHPMSPSIRHFKVRPKSAK